MRALCNFFFIFSIIACVSGTARGKEFFELVRELNAIQTRMALGETQAHVLAARISNEIEQRLPKYPTNTWRNPKNVRAAAVYLLSGGATNALKRLYNEMAFPPESATLIAAGMAYAEGRMREALSILQKMDLPAYPASLRAHLALVEGGALVGVDNPRAIMLLDQARLLMPKSLVEEAAMRREVTVIDPLHHSRKLVLLSSRYAENYRKSPFAGQFWDNLVLVAIHASPNLDEKILSSFEYALRSAPPSARLEFYFGMLRASVLAGDMEFAAVRIRKAASIVQNQIDKNRLKLYSAAVDFLSGNFEQGLATTQEIDPSLLAKDDGPVRSILFSIAAALPASSGEKTNKPNLFQPIESQAEASLLREGETSLASSKALLEKALRE